MSAVVKTGPSGSKFLTVATRTFPHFMAGVHDLRNDGTTLITALLEEQPDVGQVSMSLPGGMRIKAKTRVEDRSKLGLTLFCTYAEAVVLPDDKHFVTTEHTPLKTRTMTVRRTYDHVMNVEFEPSADPRTPSEWPSLPYVSGRLQLVTLSHDKIVAVGDGGLGMAPDHLLHVLYVLSTKLLTAASSKLTAYFRNASAAAGFWGTPMMNPGLTPRMFNTSMEGHVDFVPSYVFETMAAHPADWRQRLFKAAVVRSAIEGPIRLDGYVADPVAAVTSVHVLKVDDRGFYGKYVLQGQQPYHKKAAAFSVHCVQMLPDKPSTLRGIIKIQNPAHCVADLLKDVMADEERYSVKTEQLLEKAGMTDRVMYRADMHDPVQRQRWENTGSLMPPAGQRYANSKAAIAEAFYKTYMAPELATRIVRAVYNTLCIGLERCMAHARGVAVAKNVAAAVHAVTTVRLPDVRFHAAGTTRAAKQARIALPEPPKQEYESELVKGRMLKRGVPRELFVDGMDKVLQHFMLPSGVLDSGIATLGNPGKVLDSIALGIKTKALPNSVFVPGTEAKRRNRVALVDGELAAVRRAQAQQRLYAATPVGDFDLAGLNNGLLAAFNGVAVAAGGQPVEVQ